MRRLSRVYSERRRGGSTKKGKLHENKGYGFHNPVFDDDVASESGGYLEVSDTINNFDGDPEEEVRVKDEVLNSDSGKKHHGSKKGRTSVSHRSSNDSRKKKHGSKRGSTSGSHRASNDSPKKKHGSKRRSTTSAATDDEATYDGF